ncbi:sulfurtransferase [Microbacterium sp. Marseille-Q6965]|uniref:sulfurtransferase n=1 Tax=Microbacterium sp. Marseille-Q6965 TaxID=2965072 RepID=UPI0021B6E76B|nr:sulfurtransferase [Microbacterium sp. Marseille-Q6965]
MSDILITVDELAARIGREPTLRVLDVRWWLDRPDGRPDFEAGHIPGAVYVDLETELSAHRAPSDGRHPLPETAALQAAARRWGLNDGDEVVVYDNTRSMSAARAWWMLADAGVNVRLLDGALSAWIRAGHPLETGKDAPEPGSITLALGRLPRLAIDDAAEFGRSGVLLDVRAPERFRGEVEPMDPVAGHIPGARNLPTAGLIGDDGRFLPAEEIRARFASVGAGPDAPVGLYCGSGVSASHAFVAATLAGLRPALYPGSWSQWSNSPGRPVATGEA